MKLTTKSEYSILALVYLARNQDRDFIKIEEICSKYGISKKYLEGLFSVLKRTRYVKTKRGIHGGYRLAKPASEICLAEIIRLMDGALAPTESASVYFFSETPLAAESRALEVFREIRNYVADKLETVKLLDLA
jgi:Rrf2 family cysteine metabolism transcriptional repressor